MSARVKKQAILFFIKYNRIPMKACFKNNPTFLFKTNTSVIFRKQPNYSIKLLL